MENCAYSSYAESGDSSPRCREVDLENQSWDEQPAANYKVRFMCSSGGKIQPRPHDNQLAYVGGDTKILSVDRSTKLPALTARLAAQWDVDSCFKYQLPGEDLDSLISVTNEEDLEHMMIEYDRLNRSSSRPARLRLFLFPLNSSSVQALPTAPAAETKQEHQWFVDALNSGPMQNNSRPGTDSLSQGNPDFLFGLDKGSGMKSPEDIHPFDSSPVSNRQVSEVPPPQSEKAMPEMAFTGVHPAEIQRQVQEFQRMHIASQEQQAAFFQRKQEETLTNQPFPAREAGSAAGDYYTHRVQDKIPYDLPAPQAAISPPAAAAYWAPPTPDRHVVGPDSGVYLLPAMYPGSSVRPVAGPPGQGGFYSIPQNTIAHHPPPPPPAAFVGDPYREGSVKSGTYQEGAVRPGMDAASFPQFAYVDPGGGSQVYYYATQAPPSTAAMGLRQPPAPQAGQDQKIKSSESR